LKNIKERIQAKHMKEKENNLINQLQDSQVKTEKCPISQVKYVVHLQGSLIGRINYPGGRSSTSSGYSSGSLSSNNRWGFIPLSRSKVYLSRESSLGGNYYRRKHVGRDKSFPLDPVAGNKEKEEKRPNRRGVSLEMSRKVRQRAVIGLET
jgi:hypothetical protein